MKAANQFTFVILSLALAACSGDGDRRGGEATAENAVAASGNEASEARTVGDVLASSPNHVEFVRLLEAVNLAGTFRRARAYTVLAPNDAAFGALGEDLGAGADSADRRERLLSRLSYHVVPGTITVAEMESAMARGVGGRAEIATVTGARLGLMREGGTIVIEDATGARARIVEPGPILSNGIVHGIDTVLTPSG
jgi:uncharacterized surface protein with fasciclin (FAS1) repeats